LNPSPRVSYTYMEGQDVLCFGEEGFVLSTNPQVYTTDPIYYSLNVLPESGLEGVSTVSGQYPATSPLSERNLVESKSKGFLYLYGRTGCIVFW